ncbi:MAG: GIY-YIG nuclease family protein [Leptolyngbyaceae cyanobacterium SL_5_14]|nr:GIY-YIG nuclease family protein [Leptolyngbyaceae cyanobacterium SL_5_14]NJO66158.1 GIY-YIG nuclease family protein [Leptolyngbyaceae cyanobacterium RM1_405_57]
MKLDALPSLPLVKRTGLPECAGIYFAVAAEQVLYIGQAINLRNRWKGHHRYRQLLQMGCDRLCWLQVNEVGFLDDLEMALIRYFKPVLNQTEVIVFPVPKRERKTERISALVTPTCKRLLIEQASALGISLGEYLERIGRSFSNEVDRCS